ncbi:MAG: hypothetical protein DI536_27750 [Archangium gephyra]|uniref:Peptidase S74 domain-containing protein n=1 Tax=Archangium gephyra TaxID=48 RepID=A0A2W5SVT3_9BACT|nr:MAG: hypothetical protein DI536_27750 [Archangium gephyra]
MIRRAVVLSVSLFLAACSNPAGQTNNGLVALTNAEPAGENCAGGGVKLRFGLDANGNARLDEDEVDSTLTQYVCNGVAGANGMNGMNGLAGADGTMGTMGTVGPAGPAGAAGPATVSINTPEAPGANCRYGGVQVQFGPDVDGDLLLDPGEINAALTRFICNGTAGVDCHDLNGNDACDPATEDKDLDGDCDVDDCHTPNTADFIRNQTTAQMADFNIAGTGTAARIRILDSQTVANDVFVFRGVPCCGSGSTVPRDLFRLNNSGGFVAFGVLGLGNIPAQGAGERLMWHPFKAAFRAGSIGNAGTQWDDTNVGFYSWAGGYNTIALGLGSFAMGYQSTALGTYSSAVGYTTNADGTGAVAIGYRTTADADYSVAIGQRASANGRAGSITFADASTTDSVEASANNQFSVRAAGGYRLFTNATMTTGVQLSAGGSSWAVVSDRNAKTDFAELDGEELLHKLAKMPVQSWVYKEEVGHPRHVGPMAQDFYGAFGLGLNDVTINTLDIDGVNLAASKALERRTSELMEKTRRVEKLENEVEELKAAMRRLEQRLSKQK